MNNRKRILISGCNGAIGSNLCSFFKKKGWFVLGIDKHQKSNSNLDEYEQINFLNIKHDEIPLKIEKIKKKYFDNGLDCIINNAALQIVKPFKELTINDITDSFEVNAYAPFLLIKLLINELILRQGHVINISSIHTKLTKKNFIAYSSSKSALDGLTRALAVEYGNEIHVNGICPAAIQTDMLLQGLNGNNSKLKKLANFHPAKTIGKPKLIAETAFFLANMNDFFLNGSIIDISGGISSRLYDPD